MSKDFLGVENPIGNEDQIDQAMPYRTELRRPDLKGTFRCSLCNKIFCHSSSLSRHRMQAHFKSYTCTLCNKEITSNETLRAHMYKKHQISRMFMCRCCNWAFPDKTSLHIHMQAMATGNPGNVSIIAKSSTSPPPGASAAAAAALNGMVSAVSPRPPSTSTGAGGMNGVLNNASPLSMTPPGLAGGIFPSIPSREELISRIRERAIFGAPSGLSPASAATTSNGAGFDLASLFPNIAAAAKLTGMNPAALASLLPAGLFGAPAATSAGGSHMLGQKEVNRKRSDGMKPIGRQHSSPQGGQEAMMDECSEYPNSLVIDDEGEEINCEIPDEDEEMPSADMGAMNGSGDEYGAPEESSGNAEMAEGQQDDEEPFLTIDSSRGNSDSPSISANGSRRSSMNNRKLSTDLSGTSVTVNVSHADSPLHSLQQQAQQAQDLPILRSAISASPLNSLLYQKKLNNALRNKTTDHSLMANFFYPSPLQQLQQVHMQLAAAASASQQNHNRRDQFNHQQRRKSSSTASTSSIVNSANLLAATNGYLKNEIQLKREQLTPSPLAAAAAGDHQQSLATSTGPRNPPSEGGASAGGSHISPTESSVGSSSSSMASSAGQTSPTSILDTSTSVAGGSGLPGRSGSESCSQCTVLKGRLALAENRCRFLESKTTSQESKISRLESRIGTLESNGRRYENEAHMLRDHCEQLEKKVLDCQERVLRYLQGQQYDQDTTKQMLYDILETCRVYKPT